MILHIGNESVKGKVKEMKELINILENKEEFEDLLNDLKDFNDNEIVIINNNNGMGFTIEKAN
jgi:hypothetical protein